MTKYTVRVGPRCESVEYREGGEVHRFELAFKDRRWVVYLPGTSGEFFEQHNLTDSERDRVLPSIKGHLESRRNFWWFGPTYPVIFEPEPALTPEIVERRARAVAYFKKRRTG